MTTPRVLVCAQLMPEYDRESGSRRLFNLIEFLTEIGCSVSFVAEQVSGGHRYGLLLRRRGVAVYEGFGDRVDELVTHGRPDLVIFTFWHVAERYLSRVRLLSPTSRIVVDSVDLHFLRNSRRAFQGGSGAPPPGLGAEFVRELNTYARADCVLTVSKEEAALVNNLVGQSDLARVVPDAESLELSPVPLAKRRGLLFVGNFRHDPNLAAVEYLCREIVPLIDEAVLGEHPVSIVGHHVTDSVRRLAASVEHVDVVGWVPSVIPYLNSARVSVVPLLYGAGTKRKLIQTLMVGTPAVTTRVGVEGLPLRHRKDVLVADKPESFARAVGQLVTSDELWELLARNGRDRVLPLHGRAKVRARFAETLAEILDLVPKPAPQEIEAGLGPAQRRSTEYAELKARIRQAAVAVPAEATVAVVSRGDDDLLRLGDARQAVHFPQADDGRYAGYHPADSEGAIAHLETLRARGIRYLLFPSTAFWWLDHYSEFRAYLERRHSTFHSDESCVIFKLGDDGVVERSDDMAPIESPAPTPEVVETLRPVVLHAPTLGSHQGRRRRKRVLMFGIYLAGKLSNAADIAATLATTEHFRVEQRWVAMGGQPSADLEALTVRVERELVPKYEVLNELLAEEKNLASFDFVVTCDDDVILPRAFTDSFFGLQEELGFAIAQPARTSNSYIDHPITEQQRGAVARQTSFVEIGPVVSFHRSLYNLVFPFDRTSSMGWGYENIWASHARSDGFKIGIIDAVPVDHSLRQPVAHYSWDEADAGRSALFAQQEHVPFDECYRVLEVIRA